MKDTISCYICKEAISINSQEVKIVAVPMKPFGSDNFIQVNCCDHHPGVKELLSSETK